jgi:Tfp pilus assembly protein PilV
MQRRTQSEQGFSLFEALIAALIVAVAVAGVMKLHNHTIQQTAGNAELQRAHRLLENAQQRYQIASTLSNFDVQALNQQADQIGLKQKEIKIVGDNIVLSWQAWSPEAAVTRDGCVPANGATSCISVGVKKP